MGFVVNSLNLLPVYHIARESQKLVLYMYYQYVSICTKSHQYCLGNTKQCKALNTTCLLYKLYVYFHRSQAFTALLCRLQGLSITEEQLAIYKQGSYHFSSRYILFRLLLNFFQLFSKRYIWTVSFQVKALCTKMLFCFLLPPTLEYPKFQVIHYLRLIHYLSF